VMAIDSLTIKVASFSVKITTLNHDLIRAGVCLDQALGLWAGTSFANGVPMARSQVHFLQTWQTAASLLPRTNETTWPQNAR
jgi:hypothetical protein